MVDGEAVPPWVKFIMDELNRRFDAVDDKLDKVVTKDSFDAEKRRTEEKFENHGREISDLTTRLEAEATARVNSELAAANKAKDEAEKRQALQRATNWQWFLLVAGPAVAALVTWIAAGGLAR